LIYWCYTS